MDSEPSEESLNRFLSGAQLETSQPIKLYGDNRIQIWLENGSFLSIDADGPLNIKLLGPSPPCQICGEPSIGVACSSCGAISIAYCAECAAAHREPWGLMVACCSMLDRDGVAEWLKPPIAATLAYYGKTEDELWAEADAALDDYCAHG